MDKTIAEFFETQDITDWFRCLCSSYGLTPNDPKVRKTRKRLHRWAYAPSDKQRRAVDVLDEINAALTTVAAWRRENPDTQIVIAFRQAVSARRRVKLSGRNFGRPFNRRMLSRLTEAARRPSRQSRSSRSVVHGRQQQSASTAGGGSRSRGDDGPGSDPPDGRSHRLARVATRNATLAARKSVAQ